MKSYSRLTRVNSYLSQVCHPIALFVLALALLVIPFSTVAFGKGGGGGGITIANNTPGFIKHAKILGATDPSTVISVTAWLKVHNPDKLDSFIKKLSDKGSPNYHKWITQAQFNATYGPTSQEVNAVQNFLTAQGLTLLEVAENNMYVKVQGTVAAVQKAFHVQINNYSLNGQTYRSNKANPSLNSTCGGYLAAITGMDDYGFQPAIAQAAAPDGQPYPAKPLSISPNGAFFEAHAFRPPETHAFSDTNNTATYTGNRYGADITNQNPPNLPPQGYQPSEVYTAYKLNDVYNAGYDGTGQTIVITDAFGSSTIAYDAAVFSSIYGLPPVNLTVYRGQGLPNNPHSAGWDTETSLDVEWSHAIAPGAKIALVLADNHASLDEAINWAVVHHLGNTISNSWSTVEGFGVPAQFNEMERILQMAAAQGIDVNFSSGDSGDEIGRVGFLTVDFPASSPYATGIGGTSLALNQDNSKMFEAGWGTNLTEIADVSPSGGVVPDDGPPVIPPLPFGFQFGAGGGTSLTFAQPSFQSGFVPPTGKRMVPDIGWLADPYTGVEFIQTIDGTTFVGVVGGTSLSCPMFSGIMAICAQKAGHPLGQAATLVYGLPAGAVNDIVPVGSATNPTGVVTGTNPAVYSADDLAQPLNGTTTYFSALYNSPFSTRWFVITFGTDSSLMTGTAWDNVTGVGTPNGLNFVNAVGQ
jgi:subtilase family serine protease